MFGCIESKEQHSGSKKEERKFSWTSAGLASHLCDFSHRQQFGGAHMLMCTSGTSSLLSLSSLLPEPSLPFPIGAIHPPLCFSPGQATWDVTTLLAGWSFRNQEGAKQGSNPLYPPLLLLFPKRIGLLNSTVSLENQGGGIGAMSEINILFWVRQNKILIFFFSLPVMTFVNNSRGICIWEV